MSAPALSEPETRWVEVNGARCRVWERGEGPRIGFLAGFGGLPRWPRFLDSLAAHYRITAPSVPGQPGALGHDRLDTPLDWILATRELLERAGLTAAPLIGASFGGALAADVAALWNHLRTPLVLVAPLGVYHESAPVTDVWAQRPGQAAALLCNDPANYLAHVSPPPDLDPVPDAGERLEWEIEQVRSATAEARLLWPMCDTGLEKRLPRIEAPTLVVWGDRDQVISPIYSEVFSERIGGEVERETVSGAGHLVYLDAPEALSGMIHRFLARCA